MMDRRTGTVEDRERDQAAGVDPDGLSMRRLELHRTVLASHCRRMLGSASEADDAVQETLIRAWRALDGFEGRSSLRSWLYRIATNVCLDMRRARQRRARPIDPTSWSTVGASLDRPRHMVRFDPVSVCHARPEYDDPAEQAVSREAIRCAFVVALRHLPPRQRSVLILRDVLRWRAAEVAQLLGITAASVNSALLRARSNIAARDRTADESRVTDDRLCELVRDQVDAFGRSELELLVSLLR